MLNCSLAFGNSFFTVYTWLILLQWNGCPFFTLWEIFSSLCCMCASPFGSWSWLTEPGQPRCHRACHFPNSTPTFSTSGCLWASDIFPRGGNVSFKLVYPCVLLFSHLWFSMYFLVTLFDDVFFACIDLVRCFLHGL